MKKVVLMMALVAFTVTGAIAKQAQPVKKAEVKKEVKAEAKAEKKEAKASAKAEKKEVKAEAKKAEAKK
jgi:hypothetical protein